LPFDDDLCGNARMVGTGLPQRVVTAHAMVAGERIHDRLVEAVPHVQGAGDVGWRQQDAESVRFFGIEAGAEIASGFPFGVPATFDVDRFKALGEFHGGGLGMAGARIIPASRATPVDA
jgi:hypothetical protein